MPRLPSRDDVDGRAAPRASYNVPDFPRNPVPAAIMQLGQTVASVGAEFAQQQQRAAARAAAENERRQKLALQTSLLQMEAQWGGYADATESSTSGDPGVDSGGDPGVGGDVSGAGDVDYDAPDPGVYVAPATSEPGSEDAVPVDPAGTTTKRVTEFDTNAKKFMASVPDEMKPYADAQLYRLRTRLEKRTAKFERKESERFYSVNLSNGLDVLLDRLHSNPEEWQEVFKQGEDLYDLHPTASPGQKAVWKEKWRTRAGKRLFEANPQYFIDYQKQQQEKQPAQPKAAPAPQAPAVTQTGAVDILKKFEGFRESTYWDVNHHRVGYGSDTITDADGKVRTVRQGDRVSRADADRDLARRVADVEKVNADKYGEAWTRLDGPTRAALTSITYNYGEIPKRLLPAMRSGDKNKIAAAVRGLARDNRGVNASRRAAEADIIQGRVQIASNDPTIGVSSTEPQIEPVGNDTNYGILGDNIHPALQSIPYEDRVKMAKDVAVSYTNTIESDVASIKSTGVPVVANPNSILSAMDSAKAQKWVRDRELASRHYEAVTDMQSMSEAEIAQRIEMERPVPGSPNFADEEANFNGLVTEGKAIVKLRDDDPAAAADKAFPEVAGLKAAFDPAKPETLGALVDARLEAQKQIGIAVEKRAPLTKAESRSIAELMDSSPDAAMKMAYDLTEAVPDQATAILAQVADDAPGLAAAAEFIVKGGEPDALRYLAEQRDLTRDKNFKEPPRDSVDVANLNHEVFGSAFQVIPARRSTLEGSAWQIFQAMARRRGMMPEVNSDAGQGLYKEALNIAVGGYTKGGEQYGGITDVNGVKTIVPIGMKASEVEKRFQSISEADLAQLPPIKSSMAEFPVTAEAISEGYLVAAGDGIYAVALDDPTSTAPRFVMGADGGFWLLDMRRLAELHGGILPAPAFKPILGRGPLLRP